MSDNDFDVDAILCRAMRVDDLPSAQLLRSVDDNQAKLSVRKTPQRAFRTILIAAVLGVVLITTALAYGDEIIQFLSREPVIKQVEFEEYYAKFDDNGISIQRPNQLNEVRDRSVPSTEWTWEYLNSIPMADWPTVSFDNSEELQQAAPFLVREPSHLPDGWKFSQAELFLYQDGSYSNDVWIYYRKAGQADFTPNICLIQYYVGPDAYFDIALADEYQFHFIYGTNEVETVSIGGEEALLIVNVHEYDVIEGLRLTLVELLWTHEDMAFRLVSDNYHYFGDRRDLYPYSNDYDLDSIIETMIAIAESI